MIPFDSIDSAWQAVTMTHQYSLDDLLGNFDFIWMIFGWFWFLFPLFLYAFYAYCQYSLSKKLNIENSWFAFVPILNVINIFQIAQVSLWWIVGLFIPIVNVIIVIILAIKVNHGISVRTGHGWWWTVGLIFFSFIMFPITALTYTPPLTQSDISATPPEPTL
jgi:hypothetical protein